MHRLSASSKSTTPPMPPPLEAPGCGMGPVLQQDAQNRLLCIEGVDEVDVEIIWDPPWNRDMMTEEAQLQLGMM